MTATPSPSGDPAGHLPCPEQVECLENSGTHHFAGETVIPPEPPVHAPQAERDAYWRKHVYIADKQPQFTLRAALVGGVLGGLLSITSLYITLKTGWGLSLVTLAVLGTYAGTRLLSRVTGGAVREFSMLENSAMSSVASTASSTTGMCVVGAFGGMLLIRGEHPNTLAMMAVIGSGALLGVALSIPMKRRMVNEEDLPYPSPKAGAVMLKTLYADGREGLVQARALFSALAVGSVYGLFRSWEGLAEAFKKMGKESPTLNALAEYGVPSEVSAHGVAKWAQAKLAAAQAGASQTFAPVYELVAGVALRVQGALPLGDRQIAIHGLSFDPSIMLISVGLIIGVRVALSMIVGSALLHFVLVPIMFEADRSWLALHGAVGFKAALPVAVHDGVSVVNPAKWALWGGTVLMVTASFVSLGLQMPSLIRSFKKMLSAKSGGEDPVADVETPLKWTLWIGLPGAVVLVLAQWIGFGVNPLLGIAAIVMSFGISIVCCRACAEADMNPVGAMGKVTQLVFAFLPGAAGNAATNLLSAGSTSSAGGASADIMGDQKANRIIGANPRQVVYANLTGILFGVVCVVPAWFMLVPDKAALESKYTAIPAQMWSAVAKLLTQKPVNGEPLLPYGTTTLMIVCAVVGALIPLVSHFVPKIARWMPSTMGLGLSLVLPFSNCLSFALGALIMVIWEKGHRKSAMAFGLILASGLLSGQAIAESFTMLTGEALSVAHDKKFW